VPHWFLERFSKWSDRPAIIVGERTCSYRELIDLVDQQRCRFRATPTGALAILGEYSPTFCSMLLAALESQEIVVPLSTAAATAGNLEALYRLAAVTRSLSFAHEGGPPQESDIDVTDHPLYQQLRRQGKPGLVIFTSGTTGTPKAILHDYHRIVEKFRKPRRAVRALPFLLLDHIGGLDSFLSILSGGGTLVPVLERTPEAVCSAVERHSVELLPAPPTFLNMLLVSGVHRNYDLSSLRLITYGAEPMPATTLRRLCETFPLVEFRQTYGLSELGASPTRSRGSDDLWFKLDRKGFDSKVVEGVLWVRSPWSMLGYLNEGNPFDPDGWFNTGDMVETDGEYVRIVGRASDVINVGGEKVHPAEVEDVLLQLDNIRDVVVHARRSPITGNVVEANVSLVIPEAPLALLDRVQAHCTGKLARYKIPAVVTIINGDLHNERFKKPKGKPMGRKSDP
jgi:long-chain acyl-CoA synthetase